MSTALFVSDRRSESGSTEAKQNYSIGDLSREFGVTLRTLRFYEDKGLISPERRGTTRIYSRRDRGRLQLILRGKKVGFSLEDIKEMLDLYDLRDGQITQLTVSLSKFRDQVRVLEHQRAEIDAAIADLTETCDFVEKTLEEHRAKAS
ncbi:MAG: MerR family DNA-binding transcriptional regulator [Pseudomonadota bacterium]